MEVNHDVAYKYLIIVVLTALVAWSGFAQPANLTAIGGFEGTLPSFWTIGSQPSGATLTWATDQSRSMGHSLKIAEDVSDGGFGGMDIGQHVRHLVADDSKNVDIFLGAYVKTQGVNTAPATEDAKWYISYTF